jgi:hypothetical protein
MTKASHPQVAWIRQTGFGDVHIPHVRKTTMFIRLQHFINKLTTDKRLQSTCAPWLALLQSFPTITATFEVLAVEIIAKLDQKIDQQTKHYEPHDSEYF